MPRVEITAQAAPSAYSQDGITLTWTDCDPTNFNFVDAVAKLLIMFRNTGASTRNIVISSVADERTGRTGDVSTTLAAGAMKAFIVGRDGWAQDDGTFYLQGDHADVEIAAVILTN